ncbi:MAG: hypothetical protein OXG37_07765 [Actinomycetia bacterium]|nr:hypothetical protein [Actinomycetes bacterium]
MSGQLLVARRADDIGEGIMHGKYGVNCTSRTVFLISIGGFDPARDAMSTPCPQPDSWN